MDALTLLTAKRDGLELSEEQVEFLITNYTNGEIPDYQISALLMAIYFRGLSEAEVFSLTKAMIDSGSVLDLSCIDGFSVDKHSSGGVGDKVSLIALPIAAACGVKIAKMSGRGLGFTGGTIDKLEAIPKFNTCLDKKTFLTQVDEIGIAVSSQTEDMVKADKLLYALRDVTGTVENMGLIAASIMSKKIACGSKGIVLDVKYGSGALMKSFTEARKLADIMIRIGKYFNRRIFALITRMDEPLGSAVGNLLEVIEAIEILSGNKDKKFDDLIEISLTIASKMLEISNPKMSQAESLELCKESLNSGSALEVFKKFIEKQGGDYKLLIQCGIMYISSKNFGEVKANKEGYITSFDTQAIGMAAVNLGAGRLKKEDVIDFNAGIVMQKKLGEFVKKGDIIAKLYSNNHKELEKSVLDFENFYTVGEDYKKSKVIGDILS